MAVTRNQVHVLAEKYHGDDLVGGEVVRSWDRASYKARHDNDAGRLAVQRIPSDQQILYLQLPPDCFGDPYDQQMAQAIIVAQGRFGTPIGFAVARDAQTQRVIDVLGIPLVQVLGAEQPAPPPQPAAPPAFIPPPPSGTQRLQELETMRATGVISDAEYTRKREQIISEL